MTFTKTKLVLGITTATLTMAGALVSPQAAAGSKEAANNKVDALEYQVQQMSQALQSMQAELDRVKADSGGANTEKVQELDQWMASVKSAPVKEETKDNMVFFRGGYARFNDDRGGTLDPTSVSALGLSSPNGTLVGPISDKDAWYFGAGFDFSLNDNLFGLMDDTEVLAELGVNYTQLANKQPNGLSPQETATVAAATGIVLPAANTESATINMATVSASPKIKFLKGSAFRPWLIPVGFELNVVSPPSDAITVLTPGMVFGAGADYKIWKDLYVGADVRYHYAPGDVDGINVNAFNAGGYLGIGF